MTDAEGNHAVIESRNGEITLTQTDVVTNFYVDYDDIADSYRKGELSEEAVALLDEEGQSRYHYGYGHGYHRFATLASQLEAHRDKDANTYQTRMTEREALIMLQSVAQNEQTTSAGISMTQTSSMYNNAHRTLTVWSFQNWDASYTFDTVDNRR
ncbi:MAG: hypothetical protein Q4B54_01455 [Coriobacteriales bacterium]|nr:hypothetical protein [Coriobacteriales bacterium]